MTVTVPVPVTVRRTLPLLLLAAAVLSGCARVPTSGPVEQGDEVQAAVQEPFIRVLPQAPTAGLSQLAVLRGFLSASASFDGDHAVARDFLTPTAADRWNADAGVVVYDDEQLSLRRSGRKELVLSARVFARMDARGTFTPERGVDVRRTFRMERVLGEWRIANPPAGLYLTRLDVERSFRPFDLYFVAARGVSLVPDPVYVPVVRPGAATSLVRQLLAGPTPWLAPAVRTAFPPGTSLVVDSVPVENGVAQVDLSRAVLTAADADLSALSAQLVWTLGQLPEVTGVQLLVEGSPLPVTSTSSVQSEKDWAGFDPNVAPATAALAVAAGRVVALHGANRTEVPGPLGDGSVVVRRVAQAWAGDRIAAVSESGTRVYVQPSTEPRRLVRVATGRNFAAPSFDGTGVLWLVDQRRAGSRVLAVQPDGDVQRVGVPQLGDRRVIQVRLARDGARAAVVVRTPRRGTRVAVARVVTKGQRLELSGLRPLELSLLGVRSAAWAAADRLAVLARRGQSVVQPWSLGIDGTVTATGGSLPGAVTLAAAPGRPLLAATVDGRIWENTSLSWRELARASAPAYAG